MERFEEITREMHRTGRYPDPDEFGPACARCRHVREMGSRDTGIGWTCAAFPDGIPPSIVLSDGERHDVEQPDDGGLRYECEPQEFDDGWWTWDWDGVPVKVAQ